MSEGKRTLFHGTTLANWEKIQREGWNGPSRVTTWYCSCNEIYCWDVDKSDCDDYAEDFCIRQAFESAQTSAAVQNFQGTKLIVIRLEVPDEIVEDDLSCENMEQASVVQPEDIRQEHVTAVYSCDSYSTGLRR